MFLFFFRENRNLVFYFYATFYKILFLIFTEFFVPKSSKVLTKSVTGKIREKEFFQFGLIDFRE